MHAEQLECGYAFEEGRDGVRASSRFYSDRSGGHGRDTFMVGGLGFNSNTSIVGHSNRLVTSEVAQVWVAGIRLPVNGRATSSPSPIRFDLGHRLPR